VGVRPTCRGNSLFLSASVFASILFARYRVAFDRLPDNVTNNQNHMSNRVYSFIMYFFSLNVLHLLILC